MTPRPVRGAGIRAGLLCLAAAALAGLSGCADERREPAETIVAVAARDADDGSPQGGVKIVLVDADRNRVEAGPLVTDADGRATTGPVPPGRHAVLVFPGGGRGIYLLPPPFTVDGDPGGTLFASPARSGPPTGISASAGSPLAPRPARDDTVAVAVLTWTRPQYADVLPRITGRVIDADTGEPLPRAFVSVPSHLTLWQGRYSVRDDVTLDDGVFHVADIPFTSDPISGNLAQVLPLVVACEGYRPRTWRYEPRHGEDNLDIAGVTIELTPLGDGDDGSLAGVIVRRGAPAAGVEVGIAFVGEAAAKSAGADVPPPADGPRVLGGAGLGDRVAFTAADGSYRFTDLAAGWHVVHPGFPLDDDAVFPGQPGDVPVLVPAGGEAEADTLEVIDAIRLLHPPAGAVTGDTLRTFTWTAVAGADSYLVRLDGGSLPPVAAPSAVLPPGRQLVPGQHAWTADAFTRDGAWIGSSETAARFRVEGDR